MNIATVVLVDICNGLDDERLIRVDPNAVGHRNRTPVLLAGNGVKDVHFTLVGTGLGVDPDPQIGRVRPGTY